MPWPGLLASRLAWGPPSGGDSTLHEGLSSSPWAVGAEHKRGLPFPHFLYPFVGALQPFATSIPPLLVRGWGQHKPDSSYPPTCPCVPTPDGGTVCWLLTGAGSGVDWAAPSPLQLVALQIVVLPLPPLRRHGMGQEGSGCRCPCPPAPCGLPCLLHQFPTPHMGAHHPVVPTALSPPPLPL